jgi:hypothetical protein
MSLSAKLAAALVLVVGLVASHWYAYHAGNRNGTNAVLVKQQAADLQAWIDSATEMSVEIDKQRSINREVSNDYQQEAAVVRAYQPSGQRLRIPGPVCPKATGETEAASAGRADGAASGTVALPEDIERRLRDRRKEADGVTAICRGLQEWARANGFYGPPAP